MRSGGIPSGRAPADFSPPPRLPRAIEESATRIRHGVRPRITTQGTHYHDRHGAWMGSSANHHDIMAGADSKVPDVLQQQRATWDTNMTLGEAPK